MSCWTIFKGRKYKKASYHGTFNVTLPCHSIKVEPSRFLFGAFWVSCLGVSGAASCERCLCLVGLYSWYFKIKCWQYYTNYKRVYLIYKRNLQMAINCKTTGIYSVLLISLYFNNIFIISLINFAPRWAILCDVLQIVNLPNSIFACERYFLQLCCTSEMCLQNSQHCHEVHLVVYCYDFWLISPGILPLNTHVVVLCFYWAFKHIQNPLKQTLLSHRDRSEFRVYYRHLPKK
jgi:hypothetical protein